MYEILKDFAGALATIIAAVVGFTVIAWQTRRGFTNLIASQEHRAKTERDARADQARIERETAAEQLEREKKALAAALSGELIALWHQVRNTRSLAIAQSVVLGEMLKVGTVGKQDFTLPIVQFRVPIYEANIPKLGLLGSSLAGDVARAFSRATIATSARPDQKTQVEAKFLKAALDALDRANNDWLDDISHVSKRLSALELGTSDDPGPLYVLEQERDRKRKKDKGTS
jgi:hypothetical protein